MSELTPNQKQAIQLYYDLLLDLEHQIKHVDKDISCLEAKKETLINCKLMLSETIKESDKWLQQTNEG